MTQKALFVLATSLLLSACVTSPAPVVDYDTSYDFSQVKTFGLYEKSGGVSGDNPMELTEFQKDRVSKALEKSLTAKGFQFVEDASTADLLLSWHVNINTKTDVRAYSTPSMGIAMGYGRYNRYALYSCFTCARDIDVHVSEYDEGTFIVDLIDPARQQSIWRSVTQSRIKSDTVRDQATLDAAATRILSAFPPGAP